MTERTGSTQPLDGCAILQPALIPLRGPSGRLYGYFDPEQLIIEFKTGRAGQHTLQDRERVDLKPYLEATRQ